MLFSRLPEKRAQVPDYSSLTGRLIRAQRRLADYLNGKAQQIPTRRQQWYLAVFCLQLGGASLYLIVDALWLTPHTRSIITVEHLSRPAHIRSPPPEPFASGDENTPPELGRIRQFRQYLDSLRQSPAGMQHYESLVQDRPGLLDSLALLEQLYPSLQNPHP
jgi:hypothetical protein